MTSKSSNVKLSVSTSMESDSKEKNDRVEEGNSSTETLSAEERHTLKHTKREEPQGEEQVYTFSGSSVNIPTSNNGSATMIHTSRAPENMTVSIASSVARNNDSNLSISSGSNTNTLIIHHSVPDESWSHRWLSGYTSSANKTLRERSLQPTGTETAMTTTTFITRVNSKFSETVTPSVSFIGGTSVLTSSNLGATGLKSSSGLYMAQNKVNSPSLQRTSPSKFNSTELLDIPSSYLDQSEVLKHLINKETKDMSRCLINGVNVNSFGNHLSSSTSGAYSDQSASSSNSAINMMHTERGSVSGSSSQSSQLIVNPLDHRDDTDIHGLYHRLPPPPAYPAWQLDCNSDIKPLGTDLRNDKTLLSKSQPDLTRVGSLKDQNSLKEVFTARIPGDIHDEENPHSLKELVDILTHENSALKLEVDICHRKVAKLQRFELEMAKVEEQYEALVKLCERREQLERLARHKLHMEVRRLTDQNNELKEQVEVASQALITQTSNSDVTSDVVSLKKELNKRDVLIAQMVSQNKELIATKERQEMELTAQRQTLNEQRTHIDILDSALTNAQTNVVKLEEEVRKKQNLVEQAGQLKRLLVSIKLAADKREQSEKNLRQNLEMEILQLRSNGNMDFSSSEVSELRKELREKDEKIMVLEGEVTKWEQRFLQESAMRQIAIDAASMPKDAKIAALERNSQDSERRIAQAESEKMRQLDEIHSMNKRISVLENRNRSLESFSVEREAMIKAFQRRFEEREPKGPHLSQGHQGPQKSQETQHLGLGGPNKLETSVVSSQSVATQGSPKHRHSTSVSNISTPSVFTAPPRKDEELVAVLELPRSVQKKDRRVWIPIPASSPFLSPFTTRRGNFQPNQIFASQSKLPSSYQTNSSVETESKTNKEPPYSVSSGTHNRSGSYCLYVTPSDRLENVPMTVEKASGGRTYNTKQEFKSVEDEPNILEKKQVLLQLKPWEQAHCSQGNNLPLKSVTQPQNTSTHLGPPLSVAAPSSGIIEIQTSRGDPPPYFSYHQVLKVGQQDQQPQHIPSQVTPGPNSNKPQAPPMSSQLLNQNSIPLNSQQPSSTQQHFPSPSMPQPNSPPLPRPVVVCQRPHPPNAFCRTCLNVRRSHRQNAAAFVRRANSSGCRHNRRSAPSPASSADSLDDAPSILERLKKEWEMGVLGPPMNKREKCPEKPDGSRTLPQPLGVTTVTSIVACDEPKDLSQESHVSEEHSKCKKLRNDNNTENVDFNCKKDVAHLDRALNRLSIKRQSNQTVNRYGPKNNDSNNASVFQGYPDHAAVPVTSHEVPYGDHRNSNCTFVSQNNEVCGKICSNQQEHNVQCPTNSRVNCMSLYANTTSTQDGQNPQPCNDQRVELVILEDTDNLKRNNAGDSSCPNKNLK